MLLDLPETSTCFVDSNIFYYALVPTPGVSDPCVQLMNRAIAGGVRLFTSVPVLSDAIHKVMMSEVAQRTGRDRAGIVGYLGKHPEIISELVEYPKAMDRLLTVPMQILPLDEQLLREASAVAVRYGLLTNDAIILSLMQRHQLANLASNDDDFRRVPGLLLWQPR